MPKFKSSQEKIEKHTDELCELVTKNKIDNFICAWDYNKVIDVPTLLMGKSANPEIFLNLIASQLITISDSFDMTQEEIICKLTEVMKKKVVYNIEREEVGE